MYYSKDSQVTALIEGLVHRNERLSELPAAREKAVKAQMDAILNATSEKGAAVSDIPTRKTLLAVSRQRDAQLKGGVDNED